MLDTLLLWLHIGFAVFTLGPVTVATSATPRYIRARDVGVLRFLNRVTRIYGLIGLGVLLFGGWLGGAKLGEPYLVISMTLFVVAAVLLFIVERDQRAAIRVLSSETAEDDAKVQTGRIATLAGVIALIWVVILYLMVAFD